MNPNSDEQNIENNSENQSAQEPASAPEPWFTPAPVGDGAPAVDSSEVKTKGFYWGMFFLGMLAMIPVGAVYAVITNLLINVSPDAVNFSGMLGFVLYLLVSLYGIIKAKDAKNRSFWLGVLLAVPVGLIIFAGVCIVLLVSISSTGGFGV
jgi:hypothetical protein